MTSIFEKVYNIVKSKQNNNVAWMDAGTPAIHIGAQDNLSEEDEDTKKKKNKQGFLGGINSVSNISL